MGPKIFDRYIWRQVASSTLTGVLVLTGVMVLGNVFKEMERLLGDTVGLPILLVLQFISYVVPYSLVFTIPWALLTAILLVFGRMSADNEMTALRMTGMSMPRICLPVFILATLMSGLCYFVNLELAPLTKNKIKRLFYDVALDDPAMLFQPGKVLDRFPGYRIYVAKREGNNLEGVEIYQTDGSRSESYIRAKNAELEITPGVTDFILLLRDGQVETWDGGEDGSSTDVLNDLQPVSFREMPITFPLSRLQKKSEKVSNSMKTTEALWQEVKSGVSTVDQLPMNEKLVSSSRTELSMRYSFSLAAVVFVLVGIPLGITAQRRETSIGFALSLIVAVSYIFVIIFASTQAEKPSSYPHLLMWLPNVVFIAVGSRLFWKLCQR
ncbi:YjgP/YjgQ family permease [Phragmitibacter flavus]|uniref:YjgP/YjgQ family permease n=1 Tax=Phragmitibacter flavus TaxID=2576071 RepID=A0A5R8KEG5_9BACT|nr:LptF/LptG family permease [Phragmitibacter flavus]TLD70661.1 YjgP/YjgQ family permease [Phragmitibacter flavus]